MSYRFMRVIVFFDLPINTASERKEYTRFRKFLLKSGYLMMQESVYCKLTPNINTAEILLEGLRKHRPKDGLVQALKVTEKQYQKMEFITGQQKKDVIDSDERILIL